MKKPPSIDLGAPSQVSELLGWAREELSAPFGVVGQVVGTTGNPLIKVSKRACAYPEMHRPEGGASQRSESA